MRALACLLLLPSLALAQAEEPFAAPPADPPEEVRELTAAAAHLLAAGEGRAALPLLERARALVPADSWAAPLLDDLVRLAHRQIEAGAPEPQFDAASGEDVVTMYANLVVFGFWTGVWTLGVMAEAESRVVLPISVLTAGLGAGVAYALDHGDRPLTGGTAAAINLGLQLGTVEALLVLASVEGGFDGKVTASAAWGGGLAGAFLAGTIATATHATRGSVALVTTGALWGGVLGALLGGAVADQGHTTAQAALAGSLLGIGSMAWVSSEVPVSRKRTLFLDLGGLAGGIAAAGVIGAARVEDPRAGFGIAAGGIVTGLVVAALLTGEMDQPRAPAASVTLAPILLAPSRGGEQGRGLGLSGTF